jgi:predicted DNA-binding transcriptional regulator AlpA
MQDRYPSEKDPDELLNDDRVGKIIGKSPGAVRQMRYMGDGPPVVRLGPRTVRYRRSDVLAWIDSRVESAN